MTTHEAIRTLRRGTGLSQEKFARELDLTGRTISRYETVDVPDVHILLKLSRMADQLGLVDEAETLRETYLKENAQRNGISGYFVVEGPIRARLLSTVGEVKGLLDRATRDTAEEVLERAYERVSGPLKTTAEVMQKLADNISELVKQLEPFHQGIPSRRLAEAKRHIEGIYEQLDANYAVGQVVRKRE